MSATSFVVANTQENHDLLDEFAPGWFPGHETMSQLEVLFENAEDCARAKEEVFARSSCVDPNER
jgi:hypothetical protein